MNQPVTIAFSDEQLLGTVILVGLMVPVALVFLHDCLNWLAERLQRKFRPDLWHDAAPQQSVFAKYRLEK